jgi:starch-binding outer membrane protein, SusD/RagB family
MCSLRIKTVGILISTILFLSISGCKKYLNEKPDKNLVVPQTLQDLQGLLDNNNVMNLFADGLGEESADNYYIYYARWEALAQNYQSVYIWGDEIIYNTNPNPWETLYNTVYYANTVLENIDNIPESDQNESNWNNAKGSALFYRARAFQIIAADWANAYDSSTASSDLGIPLRLNTDYNQVSVRSNLQQTYSQIIQDLLAAVPLLPITPEQVMRPSKPAAYGLLAKVYLSMRNYPRLFCMQIPVCK